MTLRSISSLCATLPLATPVRTEEARPAAGGATKPNVAVVWGDDIRHGAG